MLRVNTVVFSVVRAVEWTGDPPHARVGVTVTEGGKARGTADINRFGHHEPPAARAPRARPAPVARGGGGVLHQNRTGLRVRGLPREVVHRRPRLRLRHRRGLLPEPLGVSVHVHRGRTRVRSPKVSPHSPEVHAHQVPGVLSGVRGHGAGVRLRGQNVPPAGGVQGETSDPQLPFTSSEFGFKSLTANDLILYFFHWFYILRLIYGIPFRF